MLVRPEPAEVLEARARARYRRFVTIAGPTQMRTTLPLSSLVCPARLPTRDPGSEADEADPDADGGDQGDAEYKAGMVGAEREHATDRA